MGTYAVTAGNDGRPLFGAWESSESAIVLDPTGTIRAGFSVQVHTQFDPAGRPLDVPIITAGTFTVSTTASIVAGGTMTLRLLARPAYQVFSNSILPGGTETEHIVGTYTVTGGETHAIPLLAAELDHLLAVQRSAQWTGWLGFTLEWTHPTNSLSIKSVEGGYAANFVTEEIHEDTGRSGNVDANSRYMRCPKSGRVRLREDMVEDGYFERMLVCQESWDPYDDVGRIRIRPDEREVNERG